MKKHRRGTELFQLISRKSFDQLADKWEMDKGVRSFSTWEMTQALLNSMIMRLSSYREIELTLGIPRSTFGDAMNERSFGFFQDLCDHILFEIKARTESRKVRKAIRKILAIDSTEARVHGSLFALPGWQRRATKERIAAAKLHVVWDVNGQWIEDFLITPGRRHDSPVSLHFKLSSNSFYVFDRAYNDINFWLKIMDAGSHFVTRLKASGTARKERNRVKIGEKDGVLYDGTYRPHLGTIHDVPRERRLSVKFRYIIYRDPETKRVFHFVTSDFNTEAQVIADIYRSRWAVELLFRWLKGHLDVRHLAARTPNAVKIQLAMAVLIQLLVQLKKIIDQFSGTPWELLRLMRAALARQSFCQSGPPDGCRWRLAATWGFAHGKL